MKYKYEFWLEDGSVEFHETVELKYVEDMFKKEVVRLQDGTRRVYINMNKVIKVCIFENK